MVRLCLLLAQVLEQRWLLKYRDRHAHPARGHGAAFKHAIARLPRFECAARGTQRHRRSASLARSRMPDGRSGRGGWHAVVWLCVAFLSAAGQSGAADRSRGLRGQCDGGIKAMLRQYFCSGGG